MSTTFIQKFVAARRCSVPIVAIETADPFAAVREIVQAANGSTPVVVWDIARGMQAGNPVGEEARAIIAGSADQTIGKPPLAAIFAMRAPERTILILHMAHRFIADPMFLQAVLNTRDEFTQDQRCLVLLGPSWQLPVEAENDVLLIRDPLPDEAGLTAIVNSVAQDAEIEDINEEIVTRLVDATIGLPAFAAEQALSLGVDVAKRLFEAATVWEKKARTVEQVGCLSVYRGGMSFDDIGGCEAIKTFSRELYSGEGRWRAVVQIDEIEKQMAGAKGDTSGVSQDQLNLFLQEMEDRAYAGMLFYGPPGAAKTAFCQAVANESGAVMMKLDLGGAKGSLVGESERKIRAAMARINAISQGKALFLGTCNSTTDLKPELLRRFTLGRWYFDLPTQAERALIWPIWIGKYNLPSKTILDLPNDEGWTGAEIKQCCLIARLTNRTVTEAARWIIPVSKATPEVIAQLREYADGRFNSASYEGPYRKDGPTTNAPAARPRRRITETV